MEISLRPCPTIRAPSPLISCHGLRVLRCQIAGKSPACSLNRSIFRRNPSRARSSSAAELHGSKSTLESLFCYDKAIPEEIIDKPVGLSLSKKEIGSNPPCIDCQEKGAILCATCSGSGLYVDSILESQGVIVKVRCLGCGGTGNIMCTRCGGRGHHGLN
ncbi:Heat shock protein DnaJ cysteine-rich domain-containing protein [Dioscorea alata]|uniref:Heat shock protein DnaJ cysteine-rich domain-containing protein n=1 Tax=Dioscorea alata TaxID=55571 RepID=A0ACB7VMC3_DIOAL|nr:Heat shock protein DnaJ cysteine-rich domain-containing protein [Dioscorea alata]